MYAASGAQNTVSAFLQRYTASAKKYRRARRMARVLMYMPTVRLVTVCNSVAMGTALPDSDIDLFIVAASGTCWITRLMVVGLLALLGMRPKPGKERDTFCASFFVSEHALDLSPLAIPGGDPYLAHWCASLIPLADREDTYTAFIVANQKLYAAANVDAAIVPPSTAQYRLPTTVMAHVATAMLRLLEPLAKHIQYRRFPPAIRQRMNIDTSVVVTDDVLKFHTNDRRAAYRERLCHSPSEPSASSFSHSSHRLERV